MGKQCFCSFKEPAFLNSRMYIHSVHYGANCKSEANSKLPLKDLRNNCGGKSKCIYRIEKSKIGDPAPGCSKSYSVTYVCGTKGLPITKVIEEADGKLLGLSCRSPWIAFV